MAFNMMIIGTMPLSNTIQNGKLSLSNTGDIDTQQNKNQPSVSYYNF